MNDECRRFLWEADPEEYDRIKAIYDAIEIDRINDLDENEQRRIDHYEIERVPDGGFRIYVILNPKE